MLLWVDKIRYIWGTFCSGQILQIVPRLCHGAANSIFGKIGRIASEESVLQLIEGKCLPIITAPRSYAIAVLGVVILSVCPSVRLSICHTDAL